MPQYTEPPENVTPFAQVLIDYMWNRRPRNRPPMTYTQLAVRLGVPKQSISNWILRGSVPPLDTIFIIMAKLGIPLSTLYSAYVASNLTVPAWDAAALATAASADDTPDTPRNRKPAAVPLPANIHMVHEGNEDNQITHQDDTPRIRAYAPHQLHTPIEADAQMLARLIAQTEVTMRAEGIPESTIVSVVGLTSAPNKQARSSAQPRPSNRRTR